MEIAVLEGIHAEISRLDSLEHTLSAMQVALRRLIPFHCLALYVKHDKMLRCAYAEGSGAEFLSNLTIAMGIGVSGWVAATGKPLLNGNALTEFGVSGAVPPGFDLQAGMAVALGSEFGPSAVLTLYSREKDAFHMDDLRALLAIESWLAYCLRLNSTGLTPAALQDAPPSELEIGVQLGRLSEHVRLESSPVANSLNSD